LLYLVFLANLSSGKILAEEIISDYDPSGFIHLFIVAYGSSLANSRPDAFGHEVGMG